MSIEQNELQKFLECINVSAYFETLTKNLNLRHTAKIESSLDMFQIQLFAVTQTLLTHNELQ
mgnify:CR=1 FL=1